LRLRRARAKPEDDAGSPTIAAAVAFRHRDEQVEVRLVRTSDGERWTFPKGRQERGETLAQTAAREAEEEAGVVGVADEDPLIEYRHAPSRHAKRADDAVAAFLLTIQSVGPSGEHDRDPTWFDLETARDRLAEGREIVYARELERVLAAAERELRRR